LAKSYVELQKKLSQKLPEIPANDNPEAWEEVYKALGRPDKPEDYVFTLKQKDEKGNDVEVDVSEQLNPDIKNILSLVAYKMGVPKNRIGDALQVIGEFEQTAPERNVNALKEMWGKDYDRNAQVVQGAMNELPDALSNTLMKRFGPANPDIAALLLAIKTKNGNPTKPNNRETTPTSMVQSRSSIQAKIKEIMGDSNNRENPYWNNRHENHIKTVAEVTKLYDQLERLPK
jgi:hypothetical protein